MSRAIRVVAPGRLALWRYELRRSGYAALALPPATAVAAGTAGANVAGLARPVLAAYAVPLVAGLVAASVVARERLVELHLSLPTRFAVTLTRRLLLTTVATGAAVAAVAVAPGGGAPDGAIMGLLAAFSLAMIALGAVTAARWRAAGPASAVVVAGWLGKLLVIDQALPLPGPQAVLLVTAALLLLGGTWRQTADEDAVLRRETS